MPAQVYERLTLSYEDASAPYRLTSSDHFNRQYAHVYAARLWTMRPCLEKAAKEKWGADITIRRLSELQRDEDCVVIGTLCKMMQLKPNILKELSEELALVPQPVRHKYIDSASDHLFLEDELQRICIVGMDVDASIGGVIVALYGCESSNEPGKFKLKEPVLYRPLPKQEVSILDTKDKVTGSLVFISGLEIGGMNDYLAVQLLVDMLTGLLGDEESQRKMSKVVRVIIAGNSVSRNTVDREQATRARYLNKKPTAGSTESLQLLDELLLELAISVPVDIMPGDFDPTTSSLPQQALHHCLFPRASRYETLRCVTNPYRFKVGGLTVCGTSGQPVQDIYRYTVLEDELEILGRTLEMGHLSPTSPDSLPSYPYADTDPFVLDFTPNVYFSGNATKAAYWLQTGPEGQQTLLLAVPKFCETKSCMVVDLETLNCSEIRVDSGLDKVNDDCKMKEDEKMSCD